jgi:hypothetical protein
MKTVIAEQSHCIRRHVTSTKHCSQQYDHDFCLPCDNIPYTDEGWQYWSSDNEINSFIPQHVNGVSLVYHYADSDQLTPTYSSQRNIGQT